VGDNISYMKDTLLDMESRCEFGFDTKFPFKTYIPKWGGTKPHWRIFFVTNRQFGT